MKQLLELISLGRVGLDRVDAVHHHRFHALVPDFEHAQHVDARSLCHGSVHDGLLLALQARRPRQDAADHHVHLVALFPLLAHALVGFKRHGLQQRQQTRPQPGRDGHEEGLRAHDFQHQELGHFFPQTRAELLEDLLLVRRRLHTVEVPEVPADPSREFPRELSKVHKRADFGQGFGLHFGPHVQRGDHGGDEHDDGGERDARHELDENHVQPFRVVPWHHVPVPDRHHGGQAEVERRQVNAAHLLPALRFHRLVGAVVFVRVLQPVVEAVHGALPSDGHEQARGDVADKPELHS
mmetsp:Transcript_45490/g.84517  ORF Transcript_45490/g.84517 Transcript_45490/m.84517 type:complete len:296 (+) Transcript_45490:520-1407(+)